MTSWLGGKYKVWAVTRLQGETPEFMLGSGVMDNVDRSDIVAARAKT